MNISQDKRVFIMGYRFFSGQSAIEYLMTYGWMLLVVAVVGGAIFSTVNNQSAESVSGFTGEDVLIDSFGVTSDGLQFSLRNGASEEIKVQEIIVTNPESGMSTNVTVSENVGVGNTGQVKLGGIRQADQTNNLDVKINYETAGLTNLQASGTVTGSLDVFNTVSILSSEFNRSEDKLHVDVQNNGEQQADSINYTLITSDNQYSGNLDSLGSEEEAEINISIDETYPIQEIKVDPQGFNFIESGSELQCTPSKDLEGYWSFDSDQIINGQAKDLSGNKNHGSLNGGPVTGEDGVSREAINFSSQNNITANSMDLSPNLTIAGWAYMETNPEDYQHFFSIGGYNGNIWAGIDHFNPNNFLFHFNGSSNLRTYDEKIYAGEWTHFALSLEGNETWTGYVDGKNISEASLDIEPPTGFSETVIGGPWEGTLDELYVYNRTLSSSEIERIYQAEYPQSTEGCQLVDG